MSVTLQFLLVFAAVYLLLHLSFGNQLRDWFRSTKLAAAIRRFAANIGKTKD